jgi:hypothetical protein
LLARYALLVEHLAQGQVETRGIIMTKSQAVAADIAALLRARNPLLWVVTREEQRVEKYVFEAAASAGYLSRTWDVAAGVCGMDGRPERGMEGTIGDPEQVLTTIGERSGERGVWILRDLPVWLAPPIGAVPLRRLRNLARSLPSKPRDDAQAIVVISPTAEVPAELANHATVLEWPLPDREEIAALLDATVGSLPEDMRANVVNGSRDAAIDAAVGLSGEEAQATFARSLVQLKKIDPATIASEKKRVIAKSLGLEWIDPLPGGMSNVGGLDNWKAWAVSRSLAYSPEARAYGIQAPKGALLVGFPGCGKSYSAKGLASEWQVPLLRLDLGALKGKYVGQSEGNLRAAFDVVEAIGRCVLWVDEIEKALGGATQGAADGGVSADALGFLLSWMQDRAGEAFVIATANNAETLPPELLRKGRFDEVWWVDLPTAVEREQIMTATVKSHGRNAKDLGLDLGALAAATETFSGAEIAALVPEAMFAAFAENGREITTKDLLRAAENVVPLAKTAEEKMKRLRDFWLGRARPATSVAAAPKGKGKPDTAVRDLDI